VEFHYAFADKEVLRYEEIGLCKQGVEISLVRDKEIWVVGKIPVNPSGRLFSLDHPLSQ